MQPLFRFTVGELAAMSGEPLPDSRLVVTRASTLSRPHGNSIIFVKNLDGSSLELLSSVADALILVPEGAPQELVHELSKGNQVVGVPSPRLSFARIMNAIEARLRFDRRFVSRDGAVVAETAQIADDALLEPGAFVDHDVIVAHDVRILSGAKVRAFVRIGDGTIIRENAVVGSAGFGFQRDETGVPIRLPHFGGVEIGRRVEIGAFTAVCAGTIDPTVIEDDVKIDNLVHIAHNCHVGRGSIITACAEVSGSVRIGEQCWIGPNACVIEGRHIGNHVTIGIGAVVLKDVSDHQVVAGNPARPTQELSRINRALSQVLGAVMDSPAQQGYVTSNREKAHS